MEESGRDGNNLTQNTSIEDTLVNEKEINPFEKDDNSEDIDEELGVLLKNSGGGGGDKEEDTTTTTEAMSPLNSRRLSAKVTTPKNNSNNKRKTIIFDKANAKRLSKRFSSADLKEALSPKNKTIIEEEEEEEEDEEGNMPNSNSGKGIHTSDVNEDDEPLITNPAEINKLLKNITDTTTATTNTTGSSNSHPKSQQYMINLPTSSSSQIPLSTSLSMLTNYLNSDEFTSIDFVSFWSMLNDKSLSDSSCMEMFGIDNEGINEAINSRNSIHINTVTGFAGCGMSTYRIMYLLWYLIATFKRNHQSMVSFLSDSKNGNAEQINKIHEDYKVLGDSYMNTTKLLYEQQIETKDDYIESLQEKCMIYEELIKTQRNEMKRLKMKVKSLEETLQAHLTEFRTINHQQQQQTQRSSELRKREKLAILSNIINSNTNHHINNNNNNNNNNNINNDDEK